MSVIMCTCFGAFLYGYEGRRIGLGGGGGALTEIYLYLTYLTLNLIVMRSEVFNYLCKI